MPESLSLLGLGAGVPQTSIAASLTGALPEAGPWRAANQEPGTREP